MASFLDTGLVSLFSIFFSFLLVYAVVWGALEWRKPFGDNKGVYAIIALVSAFLMVISTPARLFIEFVTPWFLAFMIAMFLLIMVFSVFAEVEWINVIKDSTVHTVIIIIVAIILVAGLAYVFGQTSLEAGGYGDTTGGGAVMTTNGTIVMPPSGSALNNQAAPGGPTSTGNFQVNLVNTLIHPKVLGLMMIFLLSALIVYFLSKSTGIAK